MHDWHCWPLWSDDSVHNVDPESLPLDSDLVTRLNAWTARYDSFLRMDDPRETFIDPTSLRSLKEEALELWALLREALPSDEYHVDFQWSRPRFTEPDELPPDWINS